VVEEDKGGKGGEALGGCTHATHALIMNMNKNITLNMQ